MNKIIQKKSVRYVIFTCFFLVVLSYFLVPKIYGLRYIAQSKNDQISPAIAITPEIPLNETADESTVVVTHLPTPKPVKAIYVTSWVAGDQSFLNKIVKMVDETEINSMVIDVKDTTGRISFSVNDPNLKAINSAESRIKDIKSLIDLLHKKNIYVIGRIATFQDPYWAKKWPEYAVKKLSDKNSLWQDDKCKREVRRNKENSCTYWLDAGSKRVWDYVASIGDEAYADGFDELNFDYIRFPADGDLKNIYFPISNGKVRADVMNDFYVFLHNHFFGEQNEKTLRPKISADIFGLATTETNDLGIGQLLIPFATYFDYVMPMVYPSHYAPGTYGYKNPAIKPYEIVNFSMKNAVDRLMKANLDPLKLRPWLQDFNMGAIYIKEMVRDQIKATYDAGLDSWSLWNPGNIYTKDALLPN